MNSTMGRNYTKYLALKDVLFRFVTIKRYASHLYDGINLCKDILTGDHYFCKEYFFDLESEMLAFQLQIERFYESLSPSLNLLLPIY
jgi:hypothetical protein